MLVMNNAMMETTLDMMVVLIVIMNVNKFAPVALKGFVMNVIQ